MVFVNSAKTFLKWTESVWFNFYNTLAAAIKYKNKTKKKGKLNEK